MVGRGGEQRRYGVIALQLGEQFENHGPSGLMAGANTGAVIAVEDSLKSSRSFQWGSL